MLVLISQLSAVFHLCAADEPDDLRLFSGLQLFSSTQLFFPGAQDNADSLHKLIPINTALNYFSVTLKWDSYLPVPYISPPEPGPEISSVA